MYQNCGRVGEVAGEGGTDVTRYLWRASSLQKQQITVVFPWNLTICSVAAKLLTPSYARKWNSYKQVIFAGLCNEPVFKIRFKSLKCGAPEYITQVWSCEKTGKFK